jgi:hypothetical protein
MDESPILRDIHSPFGLAQRKALIRYYFGTDPKTFNEIAKEWNQLFFALQFDGKLKIKEVKKG